MADRPVEFFVGHLCGLPGDFFPLGLKLLLGDVGVEVVMVFLQRVAQLVQVVQFGIGLRLAAPAKAKREQQNERQQK